MLDDVGRVTLLSEYVVNAVPRMLAVVRTAADPALGVDEDRPAAALPQALDVERLSQSFQRHHHVALHRAARGPNHAAHL